jgi:2-polyprenyl-3-methyl-5-hydroxy-6-metoxy-1,4-benzoquinol methylase
MKKILKKILKKTLYRFGYKLSKVKSKTNNLLSQSERKYPNGSKFHVGCGNDILQEYINVDVRQLPGVELVCKAWELSMYTQSASEIYSRHVLEHLTLAEVECTLNDWFDALSIGGVIKGIVPNITYHIEQWNRATWTPNEYEDMKSNTRWGFAGFYGWQREADPSKSDYNSTYWDIHKSAFNEDNITFLLQKAGFSNISTQIVDEVHLHFEATKILNKKERQVTPFIGYVREDHRARYHLAKNYIFENDKVLDAACGIGYGSTILKEKGCLITAVDLHEGALQYAKEYYFDDKITFKKANVEEDNLGEHYDVVVSFETIEHLPSPEKFLKNVHSSLKKEGKFICSTPNEKIMPYSSTTFPYHIKHFTENELEKLLNDYGFIVEEWFCQNDRSSLEVEKGSEGLFMIAVCTTK